MEVVPVKPSFKSRIRPRTKALIGVAASAVVALAVAPSAFGACDYQGGKRVFADWGDNHSYVLAPDGGFESDASGWSLSGGADVVAGNESHYLRSAGDRARLDLPDGSAATSPQICVALDTPVMRSMVRNTGDPTSRLRVEVTYRLLGLVQTKVATDVHADDAWMPSSYISPTLGLSTIVGTVLPAAVQVTFQPLDARGDWQVDDFYVDPYARR
jgi:hypothetical protein